tara:strand:- start:3969 stop:5645 length:1677 start_codon:yes stop_codon:yes gene_type:complete
MVKRKENKINIFEVPFAVGAINENITISINSHFPQSKEGLLKKAFMFHSKGNIAEASRYYQVFIDNGYEDERVFTNYATILNNQSQFENAEVFTRKAIKLRPDLPEAHSNLGNILRKLGKLKEAKISVLKSLEIKPNYAQAHNNLGTILKELNKFSEAEISFRKAIEIKSDFAEAYNNLGNILKDLSKLQEAEISFRKAIEIEPNIHEPYNNLGSTLKDLGKFKEAELSICKAIKIKPDFASAYLNLSHLKLLQGDYKEGLEYYEYRSELTPVHATPKIKKADINKLRKEDKVLIITEQGLGDTLQYMRYIPVLRSSGFDVSLCAQKKLHSLIKASHIHSNPLTPEQANNLLDGNWIRLISLAKYLKVNPINPIVSQPYIFTSKELISKWKNILSNEGKPIVAINWQGNKNIENNYSGRSLALENFSKIAELNEIKLLSLQKGFGSEQLDDCSFKHKFVECQSQIDSIWCFLENAAIIENCDLIITNDTSIAHLAGGMGKKVWLLLKDIPFWTWGIRGKTTFWYPSMRLFRQEKSNNWNELMIRVSNYLAAKLKTNSL